MSSKLSTQNNEDTRLLLFNRLVDWSILHEGVSIPLRHHNALKTAIGKNIKRGEKLYVKVRLNFNIYNVILTNIEFDQDKYPDHCDIIQFRWSVNSPIARDLRHIFHSSYIDIQSFRTLKKQSRVEKPEIKETVAFLFNPQDQTIDIECVSSSDLSVAYEQISKLPEDVFEYQQNYYKTDEKASIEYKESVNKIRRINRSIINDLKSLYANHCQVCGSCFERYDISISEAHHIEQFIRSLNNDSDNILILCPNHHRIIHTAQPDFYHTGAFFLFPNGLREPLVLNKHLGTSNQYTPLDKSTQFETGDNLRRC